MIKSALALFLLLVATASRATEEIPADFQANLFKKILLFDRSLAKGDVQKIAIPYSENGQGHAEALAAAFVKVGIAANGIKAKTWSTDNVRALLADTSVVYVTHPLTAEANSYCYSKKKLTIAGEPTLVEAGHASIAITKKADGKPLILVNLKRLKNEGHEFSSDLLNLAKVID